MTALKVQLLLIAGADCCFCTVPVVSVLVSEANVSCADSNNIGNTKDARRLFTRRSQPTIIQNLRSIGSRCYIQRLSDSEKYSIKVG